MNVPESRSEFHRFFVTIANQKDVELSGEKPPLLDYAMHLALYAAVTAIFLMIIALIVKLLWNCDGEEESGEAAATRVPEQSRLLSPKEDAMYTTYGTSWKDLESGSTSSTEDLYDGKICVICYDDERNCFFIPCGHCIACHTCANRIMKEDNKNCPICRGTIDKVRELHVL